MRLSQLLAADILTMGDQTPDICMCTVSVPRSVVCGESRADVHSPVSQRVRCGFGNCGSRELHLR